MISKKYVLLVFGLLLTHYVFPQQLRLASIFGDSMVIQQGIHAPVWGKASPNTLVKVQFAGYTSVTRSDVDGNWMVRMPVLDYGGPYEMKIISSDSVILKDVMVGEVWLASGQSNMEWTMGAGVGPDTRQEIDSADYPVVRYYNVARKTSIIPLKDMEPKKWTPVRPATVKDLSAVAWFFAREMHRDKKVAVGIISSSWGATSAEAWMSAEMLAAHPDFTQKVRNMDRDPEKWNNYVNASNKADRDRDSIARSSREGLKMKVHMPEYTDSAWKRTAYPVDPGNIGLGGYWGVIWFRKNFEFPRDAKRKNLILSIDLLARDVIVYLNGREIGRTNNPNGITGYKIPSNAIKAGKNVLAIRMYENWGSARIGTPETISSITSPDKKVNIPLTGEWSGNGHIEKPVAQWQNYYNHLTVQYNARIAPLIPYGIKGVIWYQGENNAGKAYQYQTLFPMMISDWRTRWGEGYMPFLFVQLANYKAKKEQPSDDDWAELREAQAKTLRFPATGMACAIDIGDPNDIHPKNKLDVGRRLYLAARHVAYGENIVYSGPEYESMKVEGDRIRLKFSSTGSGLTVKNGQTLRGFAIAGPDQKFFWAEAILDGNDVVVSSANVPDPVAVRYSWESNPDGNLYNREDLPAVPFRTDNWKMITQ